MLFVRDIFGLIEQKVADNFEDAIKDMEKISYLEHCTLRLYKDNGENIAMCVNGKETTIFQRG